jgi:hypothetical protein
MSPSQRLVPRFSNLFMPALLFFALFILNVSLVSPYIGWYDEGEMVGATRCLGISHPSGQVLFHLLGKIFLSIPFGTPAFRLGVMSAFCSLAAAFLFFWLSLSLAARWNGKTFEELSSALKTSLLFLTLAWCLSLPWWKYSLTPLVYALHLLLGFLVLWAVNLQKPNRWLLVFFILGLATVFRPTQFFAVPFVAIAFLSQARDRKLPLLQNLLLIGAFFALGRSILLYLPLRSALAPPIAYADMTRPLNLIQHVFALKFSKYVGEASFTTHLEVLRQMASRFFSEITPIGLALFVTGMGLLVPLRKKIPIFLWVALGWGFMEAFFVFNVPYPAFQSHQMILGWAFAGFPAALSLVWIFSSFIRKSAWEKVVLGALFVFVVLQLTQNGRLLERRSQSGAQDYARSLLEIMEADALYVPTEENEYFPVVGFQQSFGFRKDVKVIEPGTDPKITGNNIQNCLAQGRPLYVTRKWPLPDGWRYEARGPLLRVVGAPYSPPAGRAPNSPALVSWGKIGFSSVAIRPQKVQAGGWMQIHYEWTRQAKSAAGESQALIALFVDEEGNYLLKDGVIWLHDIHVLPPEWFSLMKAGWIYEENRILFVPSDFPPGRYHLAVGLQKNTPQLVKGKEAFDLEFYERGQAQNLQKFMGRGEQDGLVQSSAITARGTEESLRMITRSTKPLRNPRFADVAELEIVPEGLSTSAKRR